MSIEPVDLKLGALLGRRILVVDDVEAERALLAAYLQQQGCRIHLAKNGQDGLQKVQMVRPDLVLMDIFMPVLDGLSACRIMQSSPLTRDIPVIFLTGATMPEQRVQGLLAGAVDYVSKPFNLEEVGLRMAVHLRVHPPGEVEADALPAGMASNLDNILFHCARIHLLRSLAETPDLDELAALVGTNSKRLNKAFRHCVGTTVFGYLREARMKEACALLARSRLSVQAVGLEVGFTSGANFATAFRDRYGISPKRFRQARCGPEP